MTFGSEKSVECWQQFFAQAIIRENDSFEPSHPGPFVHVVLVGVNEVVHYFAEALAVRLGESPADIGSTNTLKAPEAAFCTTPTRMSSSSIARGAISPLCAEPLVKLSPAGDSNGSSRGMPYGPVKFGSECQPASTRVTRFRLLTMCRAWPVRRSSSCLATSFRVRPVTIATRETRDLSVLDLKVACGNLNEDAL